MYRVYYTDPETGQAKAKDCDDLQLALSKCEQLREYGFQYVTMVSDYHNMVGKPGVSGSTSGYVPQMLN